eukprot:Ihof_evm4s585 gene=Ihof_evmTU4s585
MKLLTHNMLQCHVKNCNKDNFPLRLEATTVEKVEAEFNPAFMKHVSSKLDWPALLTVAQQVGITDLPLVAPDMAEQTEEFLQMLHTVILE